MPSRCVIALRVSPAGGAHCPSASLALGYVLAITPFQDAHYA